MTSDPNLFQKSDQQITEDVVKTVRQGKHKHFSDKGVIIAALLLAIIAVVVLSEFPYLIALHSADKVVDGWHGRDTTGSLISAGNSVFQYTATQAYEENIQS